MQLKDTIVRNAKPSAKPRKLSDGGGLHVLVQPTRSKVWRLAYRFAGKQKTLALGVYPTVSLADARRTETSRKNFWLGQSIRRRNAKLTDMRVRRALFVPSPKK
jgi:hypothetical protein